MNKIIRVFCVAAMLACAIVASAQRFAIFSDIHVTPGNANEGKLMEAVAEVNASDVDAVIVSGDLTSHRFLGHGALPHGAS